MLKTIGALDRTRTIKRKGMRAEWVDVGIDCAILTD